MSKVLTYNPEQKVPSLFPHYVDWIRKGKVEHHFTWEMCQTNPGGMLVESMDFHGKGNSKDGKKSKHERNICFKNQVK